MCDPDALGRLRGPQSSEFAPTALSRPRSRSRDGAAAQPRPHAIRGVGQVPGAQARVFGAVRRQQLCRASDSAPKDSRRPLSRFRKKTSTRTRFDGATGTVRHRRLYARDFGSLGRLRRPQAPEFAPIVSFGPPSLPIAVAQRRRPAAASKRALHQGQTPCSPRARFRRDPTTATPRRAALGALSQSPGHCLSRSLFRASETTQRDSEGSTCTEQRSRLCVRNFGVPASLRVARVCTQLLRLVPDALLSLFAFPSDLSHAAA